MRYLFSIFRVVLNKIGLSKRHRLRHYTSEEKTSLPKVCVTMSISGANAPCVVGEFIIYQNIVYQDNSSFDSNKSQIV